MKNNEGPQEGRAGEEEADTKDLVTATDSEVLCHQLRTWI